MPKRPTYEDTADDEDALDLLMGVEPVSVDLLDPFAGLTPCPRCKGSGFSETRSYGNGATQFCERCGSSGYLNMPTGPTSAAPGSAFKISVLAARYQNGMPLFDPRDRVEEGTIASLRVGQWSR